MDEDFWTMVLGQVQPAQVTQQQHQPYTGNPTQPATSAPRTPTGAPATPTSSVIQQGQQLPADLNYGTRAPGGATRGGATDAPQPA